VAVIDPACLLVVTDWDLGFQLTSRPPLPDIAPGESYVTEVIPQRPVTLREVLVEGFVLVQISVGEQTAAATVKEQGPGRLLYLLDELLDVGIETGVRLHLHNASDVPRKHKIGTFVRDVASDWPMRIVPDTGRAEDAVRCPACDKRPGDSCDGPASHPSRRTLYDQHRGLSRPARVNVTPGPLDDQIVEYVIDGVENRCGICGQTFQIAPNDPHWSTGRGPICPERKA
jgi:hypothetical protein